MMDMCTVSHCASFSVATVNVFISDQHDANVTGLMFFRNCLECFAWSLHNSGLGHSYFLSKNISHGSVSTCFGTSNN